jgi:serine-type D-Ala-D-Ala carboxypeptidase (penicillin-binding protein 5/6)
VAANDVNATVPAAMRTSDVIVKARYMSPLVAPIKAGQKVGTLVISGAGITTQEHPLVAANDVKPKGFFAMTFAKMVQAAKNK